MEYRTVRETAEKWGLSLRMVQQFCIDGRIPGARKFGKSWAIPADAEKPRDPRLVRGQTAPAAGLLDHAGLMPLMNTPFQPGQCLAAVEATEEGPRRDIAQAEYYYFTGRPEQAARAASAYLTSPDAGARLSACLIYAYANLPLQQIRHARFALDEIQKFLAAGGETAPQLRAAGAFMAATSAVLLHLPLPRSLPATREFLPLLPIGLRAFALYVQAHYLYLKHNYAQSIGIVEAALSMGAEQYPIPAIYLHLIAVMDYMRLRRTEPAQEHLLSAWALARPDDLLEGFGEHHGLLGGMLESVIKPRWPEDFKRIIDITYRFSEGWRYIHNPDTGQAVADNLTTTEFTVAMLVVQDWTTEEIAAHMGVSISTIRRHQAHIRKKLGAKSRQELAGYMLA